MLFTFIWVHTNWAYSILSVIVHHDYLLLSIVLIKLELFPLPMYALYFLGLFSDGNYIFNPLEKEIFHKKSK